MKKILLGAKVDREMFAPLWDQYEVVEPNEGNFTYDELKEKIVDCDGFVSMFHGARVDGELVDLAPKLKVISQYGVGYDNVDVKQVRERGITFCNTPDPVTEPTAELAMGLTYDIARRISECDRRLRAGDIVWGPMENMATSLFGKTVGIIGMGRIGRAFARRAHAAGMVVVYHNRHKLPTQTEWMYDARYVSKEELLSISDVVSLHTPASSDTFHLIGKEELAMMKNSAFLINTSRGTVVDEEALVAALKSGEIAGAALDVYEKGDGNPSLELLELDNAVCLPHLGSQTRDTRIEMGHYASQNIINYFNGEEPLAVVEE